MRIGVDFDNTIINYEPLFTKLAIANNLVSKPGASKADIRSLIIEKDGHDLNWQKLQAQVYGEEIEQAQPFDGFEFFLKQLRLGGHEIFVVSHKTEVSNFDKRTKLREPAIKWLSKFTNKENGGIGIPPENIFFLNFQLEKIKMIARLQCEVFIDDLLEVFESDEFPRAVTKLWLTQSRVSSKSDIFKVSNWREVAILLSFESKPIEVERIAGPGNSQVIRFRTDDKKERVLKEYFHVEGRELRALTEFTALTLLWNHGLRTIPEPIALFSEENLAVYSLIRGERCNSNTDENEIAEYLYEFLLELGRISKACPFNAARLASESRLRLKDYESAIARRFHAIEIGCLAWKAGGKVATFLKHEFVPLRDRILEKFHRETEMSGCNPDLPLGNTDLILSPSDFGLHNALKVDGKLVFLDFEYFGWDDPAKLLADFFHTVAQNVSWQVKWGLLDKFCGTVKGFSDIRFRWDLVIDLVGIEWLLIVLNIVDPEVMKRKHFATPGLDENGLILNRLSMAKSKLSEMKAISGSRYLTIPGKECA